MPNDRASTSSHSLLQMRRRTAALRPTSRNLAPESSNGWSERSTPGRRTTEWMSTACWRAPLRRSANPDQVVRQSKLSHEQKREILRRWALETYRTARTDFSRLDKLIDALIDLDEPEGLVVKGRETLSGGARAA